MKEIPLSQYGKRRGQYFALVDDEDYEWLMQWNWSYSKPSMANSAYAQRTERKPTINKIRGKCTSIPMHREIVKRYNLLNVLELIDHDDHNGLNNQKHNLRKCSHSENQRNRMSAKNSTSQYLGVYFIKKHKKWGAALEKNNKTYWLGSFKTEAEAALAYNEAAKKHHGEFANLNKIYCNPCVVNPNNLIQKFNYAR